MATLSDIALVAQVAIAGQRKAFDELVRRHQSPVRRFLLNLTMGNAALADDLAQDTFVKAYVNIGRFRGLSSFQTWLMRIAYNVFYDYQRSRRIETMGEGNADVQDRRLENSIASHHSPLTSELKLDIYTALSQLKEEERTCIVLQLIDGYPIGRIAAITGMKEGTVKSHLSRGKERLAIYLKQNGYG